MSMSSWVGVRILSHRFLHSSREVVPCEDVMREGETKKSLGGESMGGLKERRVEGGRYKCV
jgi:hypothetical protein